MKTYKKNMEIQNKTTKDLRLRFWEIVNENDVNQIGVLDILANEKSNGEMPQDANFVIEELK